MTHYDCDISPVNIKTDCGARPPLGLTPKWLWLEKQKEDRIDQIRLAISIYFEMRTPIHEEWIVEYNELIKK